MALWEVCLKFDESRGFQFSTYAVPYIVGAVKTLLRNDNQLKLSHNHKLIRYLIQAHNFKLPLSEEEIQVILADGVVTRKQLEEFSEPIVSSLECPINSTSKNKEIYIGDIVADPDANIEDKYTPEEIDSLIEDISNYASPLHKDLIAEWLHSIAAGDPIIQEELAKKYNLSQSMISRTIKKTLGILNTYEKEVKALFGIY